MEKELVIICRGCQVVLTGGDGTCPKCGELGVEETIQYEWVAPTEIKKLFYCAGMVLEGKTSSFNVWQGVEVVVCHYVRVENIKVGQNGKTSHVRIVWSTENGEGKHRVQPAVTLTPRQFRKRINALELLKVAVG